MFQSVTQARQARQALVATMFYAYSQMTPIKTMLKGETPCPLCFVASAIAWLRALSL
jgi:hypothetical protein